ncbi:capsid protein [Candidatus Tokpelaia sp.]|uniref:major capsid protein n=1 Tax=Candidatus Tokpelaia sp. TaxID=2233777 RepID=UPI00123BD908|nr:capsid protein [Candidatus Tokpelaia sp.]KAA6405663.1 capsid protein [Candidatus Tokpelaia sp.]
MNRPFPVDPTLTAIAIAYRNPAETLIGERILPTVQVLSESFKYSEYPIEEGFTVPDLEVGRKSRPNIVEFSSVEKTAKTSDYGLDDAIPNSDIKEAETARAQRRSTVDPEKMAVEGLANLIQLGREIRVAAVVQDKKNYTSDRVITLSGNDKFSDYANSDPYGVLDDAMEKTLVYRPNTIVMGRAVWSKLKRHPRLIKAVKGGITDGADGFITRAQFADLMEINPEGLQIGSGLVNTARKGQKAKLERVWGNNIALLYIDPTKRQANDAVISWGFTAQLGTRISGSIEDKDIGLEGGKRVRVGERCKELAVAKDVGVLLPEVI